jgi:hypothetical protein
MTKTIQIMVITKPGIAKLPNLAIAVTLTHAGPIGMTSASTSKGQGDYGPLGEILALAMYDKLNRFIVPSLAGPARLVPLATLVDREFSIAALRQAAQRSRLDAIQGPDGIWRLSRKAVQEYRHTKGRRRPL